MKAAPYVSRMSAIAEPGMSMCRVWLYAVENNGGGSHRNNRKCRLLVALYLRTSPTLIIWNPTLWETRPA
jgi:hypothetical protein